MSYRRDSTFSRQDSDTYDDKRHSDSGSYTYYSGDSFYSDDDRRKPRKQKKITKKVTKQPLRSQANPPLIRRNNRLQNSSLMSTPRTYGQHDALKARVASARRAKMSDLHNQLGDLQRQNEELLSENKTLKRQQRIQEKALNNHEQSRDELPALLRRHAEETRINKERIRTQSDKNRYSECKLKDIQDELERIKLTSKRLQKLVDGKELASRDSLTRDLFSTQADLESSEHHLKEVHRHVENLNKNHRHEVGIERARHNETKALLNRAQDKLITVSEQLKEKEKELDINNIYANRLKGHRLNNTSSSSVPVKVSHKSAEHSPRKRININEIENKKQIKRKPRVVGAPIISTDQSPMLEFDFKSVNQEEMNAESFETPFITETVNGSGDFDEQDRKLREQMEAEEIRRDLEIKRLRDLRISEEEDKQRLKKLKIQQEEQEMFALQLKKEQELRDKNAEVNNKEERARKDALLAKMRSIDNRENTNTSLMAAGDGFHVKKTQPTQFSDALPNSFFGGEEKTPTPPPSKTLNRQRPSFFDTSPPMKDETFSPPSSLFEDKASAKRPSFFDTPSSSRKSSVSRPTVDNLHNGVPTHSPILNETKKKGRRANEAVDSLADSGYTPSLILDGTVKPRSGGARGSVKRTELLTDLFPATTSPESISDGIFDLGENRVPVRQGRRRTSTLVTSTRPTINAIGAFDDDIEEMKL